MASRGSTQWRYDNWGIPCRPLLKSFMFWTGWTVSFDHRVVDSGAAQALDRVFRNYGYRPHAGCGAGVYNCRDQKGHPGVKSSHSWATSVDVNPCDNPYRTDRLVTDMPSEMIEEIEALRTVGGAPVFRWGGDWDGRPDTAHSNYDSMHFECVATPAELATGVCPHATPPPLPAPPAQEDEDDMFILNPVTDDPDQTQYFVNGSGFVALTADEAQQFRNSGFHTKDMEPLAFTIFKVTAKEQSRP